MAHVTPLMAMYALVILQLVICLNFRVNRIYSMHMHHILTLLYIMHHIPTLLYMYPYCTSYFIAWGETHVKDMTFNGSKIY